jgi:chromosome partitioning protein
MKVVVLVTQKGGSGKSTVCVSLAVAAQEAKSRVCILEIDKQSTATQWAKERGQAAPEVGQITADRLATTLQRIAAADDYDFVFIDTPGIDSPGTHEAIRLADLCLIPCRPTPADLRGIGPTLAAVHRLEKDFAFVLNQTPPRSYRVRETEEGLKVLGVLADVRLVMRTDHQDAVGQGKGVTEFNPGGQAATEMRQLWAWVYNRTKDARHVQAA